MFNWIKTRKSNGQLSRRKVHRQNCPKQSSFRPRLEPLEKRELLYAGALDQDFGFHGMVLDSTFPSPSGGAVALQADGKILLAGTSYTGADAFVLERYNADGGLDASFGTSGIVNSYFGSNQDLAYSVAVQVDGKILVAGSGRMAGSPTGNSFFAIVRYNPDGSLAYCTPDSGSFLRSRLVTPRLPCR